MNGDTDTLCAMACAVAGAYYKEFGFQENKILKEYLDIELYSYYEEIEKYIENRNYSGK